MSKTYTEGKAYVEAMDRVEQLAREYVDDVLARRRLGDVRAEYHAQRPKVEAYKILIDAGVRPKDAPAEFREVLASIGTEVSE